MEDAVIQGTALRLFEAYLKNRYQQVKVEDEFSGSKLIKIGVSQGTVLGPTLCSIYVNSLYIQATTDQIVCFADDTLFFMKQLPGKN